MYHPETILNYIESLPHNKDLLLETLTKKLVITRWPEKPVHWGTESRFTLCLLYFYFPIILKTIKPRKHKAPLHIWFAMHQQAKQTILVCPFEISRKVGEQNPPSSFYKLPLTKNFSNSLVQSQTCKYTNKASIAL